VKRIAGFGPRMVFALSVLSIAATFPRHAAAANNQPPSACFSVTPQQGTVQTAFAVNAACSTDDRTPASKLRVRWDWTDDGVWDTAFTTTKTATQVYPAEGNRRIRLQVQDQQGLAGTITREVVVAPLLTETPFGGETIYGLQANEPDIDVNPLNPLSLIIGTRCCITSQTGMVPYPAFYSADGALSWSQAFGVGPNDEAGDPAMEFDADGRAFFMEHVPYAGTATPQGIYVARSDDGGSTFPSRAYALDFSTPFALPGGGTAHACGELPYDYPKMGADKGPTSPFRNYLYVSARASIDLNGDGVCDSAGMAFVRSTDHGATWNSAKVIESAYFNVDNYAVAADGAVFLFIPVSASDPRCGSRPGIVLRRSTDGGAAFTSGTCIFADATGEAQPNFLWPAAHPSDPAKIYLAFDGHIGSLSSQHIFFLKSADGGNTWTAPLRTDDTVLDDHVDHYSPSLSVTASGRLDLSWFDYRNSSPTIVATQWQPTDVYHSFSLDAGATWAGTPWGTANVRLTPVTATTLRGGGNDFLTTIASGDMTYVAYAQDRSNVHLFNGFVAILQYH
jgi:hypothetical protein